MRRLLAVLVVGGVSACSEVPAPPGQYQDMDVDATVPDAGTDAGPDDPVPPTGCFLDSPLEVHRSPESLGPLAFAGGSEDFVVAYTAIDGDGRQVQVRRLDVTRSMDAALPVTTTAGDYTDLALVQTSAGWLVAFTAGGVLPHIVGQHLPLTVLAGEGEAPAAIELAGPGSSAPALSRTGDRVLLAYRSDEGAEAGAFHRFLGPDGTPTAEAGLVGADDVVGVRAVASSSGFYVGWSNAAGRVFGRVVASTSMGQTTMLNEFDPSPTGAFELGYSGAAFSSVTGVDELGVRTVRFRHITTSGSVLGQPTLLPYRQGEYADFSITRFAAGFAIAYRHAELGRNQLRIALVDTDGEEHFNTLLRSVSSGDGDVEIRQSTDGQLAVLWSDTNLEGENILRIAGVQCNP